jgi:hypothetical protein
MKIIDDTYNGAKYPIIEREYNAYYFPDNSNPDSETQQPESLIDAYEHHNKTKVYNRANPS